MSTEKASGYTVKLKGIDPGYHADLVAAIEYLKSIGCSEIYLFGSLQSGRTHEKSDIDIAVRGIKPEVFFFVLDPVRGRAGGKSMDSRWEKFAPFEEPGHSRRPIIREQWNLR